MYKLPKFIIIYEPDPREEASYLRSIESLGHSIQFVRTDDELLTQSHEILPDLIVINDTAEIVDAEKILKRLKRDPFLENCSFLMLVEKIGHAASYKAKQMKVELEEFPIHNNHFLQMIKKINKGSTLPKVDYKCEYIFSVNAHIELREFNSLGFSFLCPMKLNPGHTVRINSDFILKMEHHQNEFYIISDAIRDESGVYLSHVRFKGLSVEVLKFLKNYTGRKIK